MPSCRHCKLYDIAAVKDARGRVLSNRIAACNWVSTEVYPESVRLHLNGRPKPSWMQPGDGKNCPTFEQRQA